MTKVIQLDPLDRVFYMRTILGLIAGIFTGFAIAPGTGHGAAGATAVLVVLVLYIISYQVAKGIAKTITNSPRRKWAAK